MDHGTMASAGKLTYADLLLLPEDGKRHELIDGEHYVSASPNVRHQVVCLNLVRALDAWVRPRKLGRVLFAPLDIVLTESDVVEPDLFYVSAQRSELFTPANLRGAPDLAIEVMSPSNRRYDEITKRDLYERRGLAEYWLVDPEAETVKVFRGESGHFARPMLLSLHDGDAVTTPLLPDFALPLAEVFAD